MPKLTIHPDGTLEAVEYARASFTHNCECGQSLSVTLDFPVGLILNSTITLNGSKCPVCGRDIVLPKGSYTVRDYKLVRLDDSEKSDSFEINTSPITVTSPKI